MQSATSKNLQMTLGLLLIIYGVAVYGGWMNNEIKQQKLQEAQTVDASF